MIRYIDIGDSWNAGYSDVLKQDTAGWVGLLDPSRFQPVRHLSVSGSTAAEWAAGCGGRLEMALSEKDRVDAYFVSLMGNDAFAATRTDSDGGERVTLQELGCAIANLRSVVSRLRSTQKRVLLMQYANPYPQDMRAAAGCAILNSATVYATADLIAATDYIQSSTVLDQKGMMSGIGIHPSAAGYAAIARLVERMFV